MVLLWHTSVREARVGESPGTKQTKCGFAAVLFKWNVWQAWSRHSLKNIPTWLHV